MIITHVEYFACPNTPEGRRYATMVEQEFRDRQIKCGTHTTTTSIVVGYEESFSFKPGELEVMHEPNSREVTNDA